MLILKHLYQWSYKECEGRVADSLVLRWFCRVAFHVLNDRVVQLARQARVTKGRKLRLDARLLFKRTSITPGACGLLVDSVRVLSRFVQRAKGLVKEQMSHVQQLCRSRLRTARQTAQTLHRQLRRTVEFGRHVILDEVEGGIVTRYQILEHPTEHGQVVEAVAHHGALFAHPPGLVAGDRGVQSAETEEKLKAAGVKRVAIPAAGKLSPERQALERSRPWRRGYRLQCGHRGTHCEPQTRFQLAHKSLSRGRRDGAVAGPGGHRLEPAPHCPSEVNPTSHE